MKKFLLLATVIFGLIVLIAINPFTTVDAGERGVVLRWGAFEGRVFEPGLHLVVPIAESVVKMDVRSNKYTIEASEAYSKDLQVVNIESALLYQLDPIQVGKIYQEIGPAFEEKVIQPSLEAAIKQTIAKYTAEEILNQRALVQDEIEETVRASVLPNHIIVSQFSMVNESFSPAFEAAIERKQIAEQDSKRAENELKTAKIQADQRVAQAQAEATAIRLQSEAANNDKYIALKALEAQVEAVKKWNGQLPQTMVPGASLPFINVAGNN
jgi:regulator of protease activity HflC (stomatin/prohibitin superfamily)